jgi:undecaprenyl-diphosphatase
VTHIVGTGLIWFGVFVGIVVGLIALRRYLRKPDNRARVVGEMEKYRAGRWVLALARRVRPQAVFLWQRVTPGGLGLELTTLLAVLSVALFVLISYWSIVGENPAPTGADEAALEFADDVRTGWLDAMAKVVTVLGAGWVVYPIALTAVVALGLMRRPMELCVLLAGMLVIAFGPDAIKEWTERPRPPDSLVDAEGYAFPSGHAANSTLYVWLAATLAWRIDPSIVRRGLVIGIGIAFAAVIGLSRVYLRVHWLSDVSSGWALGMSGFAAAAAVALVLTHMRHNPGRDAAVLERSGRAPSGHQ